MTKLIKFGSRQGWHFTVITASEPLQNIPSDPSLLKEIPSDLDLIRLPSNLGAKGKILSISSFSSKSAYWKRWLSAFRYLPDMRLGWLPQAREAVLQAFHKQKYDCLLISLPPYSLGLLAADLFQKEGLPVILDLRDPWSGNPYKLYPTRLHSQKDFKLEKQAVRGVKYGISAYQQVIRFYEAHIPGFQSQNWITIPNGYDEEDFKELVAGKPPTSGFNMAFSGTFYSHINNPEPFFRALKNLRRQDETKFQQFHFYHFGKSDINVQRLAQRYGLGNKITQTGYLSHREALEEMAGMDAFVFILDDRDPRSANTIGGKVYEYLRLRKPILALVPEEGEAAELIRQTDSGRVVSPQNTTQITAVLEQWIETPPRFSFRSMGQFSRELQAKEFLKFFQQVAKA